MISLRIYEINYTRIPSNSNYQNLHNEVTVIKDQVIAQSERNQTWRNQSEILTSKTQVGSI